MTALIKPILVLPLLLITTYINPIDYIILSWILLLYIYIFEKRYNYTYILYIFNFIYIGLSFSLLKYILIDSLNTTYMTSFYSNLFFTDLVKIKLVLYIDNFSANFMLLTSLLSCVIFLYAYNYMKADMNINTFIKLLIFFSISMITLLSAGDVFSLILGWELIGIASFLLINFWYTKPTALKSALKAFSFNKLSDALLILFIIIFLQLDVSLMSIYQGYFLVTSNYTYLLIPLLGCSFCKSVQFGFHLWLPDSMEAPVPASALIHSATLVSAGLYISYRFSPVLRLFFLELSLISTFTAFYGSFVAASQTDLKKILAYSTISHCGYLFFTVFYGNTFVFILYLHLHGFFKAFAFILVGFILQNNSIYQDSRVISSGSRYVTFEFFALPVILMNLAGLPFVFGFFSKFYLLSLLNSYWVNSLNLLFIKLGSFGSIVYSAQMIRIVFFSKITTSARELPNIFTKKWNHIYIMMISLGLIFITYLSAYITNYDSTLSITNTSPVFLILFYKLFLLFYINFFNIRSLGTLFFAVITLVFVFF